MPNEIISTLFIMAFSRHPLNLCSTHDYLIAFRDLCQYLLSHHLISAFKESKSSFDVNRALATQRTSGFAGFSQFARVLPLQYGFRYQKNEECRLLLPLNRNQDHPAHRDGCVFEPATVPITASSTWEFQLAHQTCNTKVNNSLNLVFSYYHLPFTGMFL